jgi:glycosyltransferase involved in cell wall biosynthesis
MNIIIITHEAFPTGMACTNRILSYSKGIVELGHFIKIIILRPTEKKGNIFNNKIIGNYLNVEYEYVSGTTLWSGNKIYKLYYVLKGYFKAFKYIKNFRKKNRIDAILSVSNYKIEMLVFFIICKIYKIKYIKEKSEYPFILNNKSHISRIYGKIYVNTIYKLFDGMIVMTNNLFEYYKNKVRKNALLFVIPMTVEFDRFQNIKIDRDIKYFAYCGEMGGNKDGVENLINAFYLVSQKYMEYYLYLIGTSSDPNDFKKMKMKVKELSLENKIVFTGRIDRGEIPNYLCNASILVLARPSSLQSHGGFPTKLGEYLSTGNPVIVTKVGEIAQFLTDGENAFLVEPDNVEAFASKMEFVINNPEIAKKVGQKGKDVVLKEFNYKTQARKIIEFIQSINN